MLDEVVVVVVVAVAGAHDAVDVVAAAIADSQPCQLWCMRTTSTTELVVRILQNCLLGSV